MKIKTPKSNKKLDAIKRQNNVRLFHGILPKVRKRQEQSELVEEQKKKRGKVKK